MTYYKAVRESGASFHDNGVVYRVGETVTHPKPHKRDASGYLSVATTATDCTGMSWPCRLFEVEPIGETWQPDPQQLPNKVACHSLRVVRELDAAEALGPQGSQLKDLIGRARQLTEPEVRELQNRYAARYAAWYAARDAARDAAWDAARYAARDAARDAARYAARYAAWYAARDAARYAAWYAARDAAWDAAWDAALALSSRDLISEGGFTQAHYDLLTRDWREVVGKVHPDDE